VDAGLFARALTRGAALGGTLEAAAAQARKENVQGSATMTICKVDLASAKCHSQVLGDSQVAIIRGGKVVERCVEQEHSFGVPFQLSSCEGRDQPKDCLSYEWDLQPNDHIVVGTDGLFDNLGDDDIAKVVTSPENTTVFSKAVGLCQLAFNISQSRVGDTPYSRGANEALNLAFSGGKKDDITAIVAFVR
jgi:protein phosphatase PTC7